MNPFREFVKERYDLADGSRVVFDVRDLITLSLAAKQHFLSPNTWSQDLSVKWATSEWGHDARAFSTPKALTAAAPDLPDIDVSSLAYIVIAPATHPAAVTLVRITGTGKADPQVN